MNNRRNILFLSYDGLTDPLGQSQVIPYLSGLAKKGYLITILSCEKKDRFKKLSVTIKNILDTNGITWSPVSYSKKITLFSPLFNLLKMYFAAKVIFRTGSIQVLHCRSTLPAILGSVLQKKNNSKLLFDMRGFWADERVEGGLWPQSKLIYRIIYKYISKKENTLINNADHIISLTAEGKRIIESKTFYTKKQTPVTVIPCCADFNLFDPGNINPENIIKRKKTLAVNEKSFVIAYLGSIGTWYMLDEMLLFFKSLVKEIPGACFLFITNDNPSEIISAAVKIGIDNSAVRIISAERNEIPGLLAICNASIFFIIPTYSKKASSPTKFGESLAMGIPVICNIGVGDGDYIMQNNNAGWVVDGFDTNSFQKVIQQIKAKSSIEKREVRKIGEQYFSLEHGIEKYDLVYRQLLS